MMDPQNHGFQYENRLMVWGFCTSILGNLRLSKKTLQAMRPRAMETDHGPSFCWYSDGKELELSSVIDFCVVEMNGPRTHIWFIDFVVIMLNSPKFSNASKFDTCPFVWNASLAKPVLRDASKRTISANETGCCHRAESHECCKKGRVSNNHPWTAITEKSWFSNNGFVP